MESLPHYSHWCFPCLTHQCWIRGHCIDHISSFQILKIAMTCLFGFRKEAQAKNVHVLPTVPHTI